MTRDHEYRLALEWDNAKGGPTTSYLTYSREFSLTIEGKPTIRGSADPQFRGQPALHNPEDLLVAALASCHMLSYLAHASRNGLAVLGYSDDAVGSMSFEGGSGQFTDVILRPRVVIGADADADLALKLHHDANHDCFIARSVNFPVRHEPTIVRG